MSQKTPIYLNGVFKYLDFKLLEQASEADIIGCPFQEIYGGPKKGIYNDDACEALCGILYSEFWDHVDALYSCPCFVVDKKKIKSVFWEAFYRALA